MQIRVLKFGRNVKTTKSSHIITFPNIFCFCRYIAPIWGFFDYTSNEALHLSAAEVNIFRDVLTMIKQELQHPIDKHSRELIVSNIELLLNYCLRFYDRQFITREEINHSVVKKFISLLDEYITRKAEREGLPTVAYFADKCCYSTKYFGELVKTVTG